LTCNGLPPAILMNSYFTFAWVTDYYGLTFTALGMNLIWSASA
jgi:hypothetical protein